MILSKGSKSASNQEIFGLTIYTSTFTPAVIYHTGVTSTQNNFANYKVFYVKYIEIEITTCNIMLISSELYYLKYNFCQNFCIKGCTERTRPRTIVVRGIFFII